MSVKSPSTSTLKVLTPLISRLLTFVFLPFSISMDFLARFWITVSPPLLMLERSCLAIPVITAVSLGTSLLLPSRYVIVTLPFASTAYSPGLMWRSSARTFFNWLTLTASLSFTPAFTLVMFKPPALIPVLVMEGPLLIVKPLSVMLVSPIFKEPSGVKSMSLFKEYVYVCSPMDWLMSCLTVKFLPAA